MAEWEVEMLRVEHEVPVWLRGAAESAPGGLRYFYTLALCWLVERRLRCSWIAACFSCSKVGVR